MNTLLQGAERASGELRRRGSARANCDAPQRGSKQAILPAYVTGGVRLSCGLASVGQRVVLPLARAAGALASHKAWFAYGYRNLDDFARERFHKSGRWCRDLVRLQGALDEFPQLGLAVCGADGEPIGQKAALCVSRVATTDDVGLWIARARELSLPALQRAVEAAEVQDSANSEDTGAGVQGRGVSRDGERADTAGNPGVSSEARVTIRVSGPPEAKIAFDAVKELHAAVAGRERGTEALVEAMVGEAASAGWPPLDEFHARMRRRFECVVRREAELSQGKSRASRVREEPAWLREGSRAQGTSRTALVSPAMRRAQKTLDEFTTLQRRLARLEAKLRPAPDLPTASAEALRSPKTRNRDIRRLVGILVRLIRLQDSVEIVMGDLLLEMHEHKAWKALGYSGLEAYAEECLGLGRSTARRRVSLARQLRRHRRVRQAYDTGLLGEEAAQWVARRVQRKPADTEAEQRWIAHASAVTVKRLRDEEALLRREKLLGQVMLARTMTARRVPGSKAGLDGRGNGGTSLPPDDATWHASLQRTPGRTRDWIFDLEHGLLERVIRCGPMTDAPIILSLAPETAADFLACIEALRRELSEMRPESAAEESRLRPSARMARHYVARAEPVPSWVGLLGLLEECAWIWDEPRGMPRRPFDRVYRRDGYRCMAPGCTARVNLEAHHLQYRSWGGNDDSENLVVLCLFHHQQGEHGLLAQARGRAPLDVTWRLGDAEFATWWRNEKRLGESRGKAEPLEWARAHE